MADYKHPCNHCEKFIPADSKVCPFCGTPDPFVRRCPKCRKPVEPGYINCSGCGFVLRTLCPHCGKETFTGPICEHCRGKLTITCRNPKCGYEQYPASDKCIKCNIKLY